MSVSRSYWALFCVVVFASFAAMRLGDSGVPGVRTPAGGLDAKTRAAGFTWAPGTSEGDKQVVVKAIAAMRPEARRLVEIVDGLVTVQIGDAGDATGFARTEPDGSFTVVLDFALLAGHGERTLYRLTHHELGHVVDAALLDDATRASLDAKIPAGFGCDYGYAGACAPREERFAETFAKWASNDIGVGIYLGYKVPPPSVSLEEWGTGLHHAGAA